MAGGFTACEIICMNYINYSASKMINHLVNERIKHIKFIMDTILWRLRCSKPMKNKSTFIILPDVIIGSVLKCTQGHLQ